MRGELTAPPPVRSPGPPTALPPTLSNTFDRRLNGPKDAPVAVALSGGGDSLALLRLAKTWADGARRPLIALTVDHRLQAAGADWARFCADRARRLGIAHRTLTWAGDKPLRGLPAAARAARHALLAEAARAAGARVILMGHTADDRLEAELMRVAGSSAPSPRVWSPSPAWPEGRGVFLLRPLLDQRRATLRAYLAGLGEAWIDDPANDDPRFARTLARRRLADGWSAPPGPPVTCAIRVDVAGVREGRGGELTLPRSGVNPPSGGALLGALALCAAGTTRPPTSASIERLLARLAGREAFAATLAGARIEATGEQILVCRDAGEQVRRGLAPTPLTAGESVFDGRFLIQAAGDGFQVSFLRGLAARLAPAERARLASIPAPARGALPAVISATGDISCPVLSDTGPIRAHPLTRQRLVATVGDIRDEAALWRVAEWPKAT